MKHSQPSSAQGFTLVELAIVLVVIGLVVGGVLVGRDMIQQARIRKVVGEVEQYQTAVNIFKDKYNGLPGDLPTAGNFWPLKSSADYATCMSSGGGSIDKTCIGNGNGRMDEGRLAMNHLSLAGLIAGPVGNYDGGAGWSSPQSQGFPTAYFTPWYYDGNLAGLGLWFWQINPRPGNQLNLGYAGFPYGAGGWYGMRYAPIASEDAYALDRRFDDGNLGTGRIQGQRSESGAVICHVQSGGACALGFETNF